MEETKARGLLQAERQRTEALLRDVTSRSEDDRRAANDPGDMFDSAEPLVSEGLDDSVVVELERRLEAVARAEKRLEDGTYGVSILSGEKIPDDRLEADPTAELTFEEAQRAGQ